MASKVRIVCFILNFEKASLYARDCPPSRATNPLRIGISTTPLGQKKYHMGAGRHPMNGRLVAQEGRQSVTKKKSACKVNDVFHKNIFPGHNRYNVSLTTHLLTPRIGHLERDPSGSLPGGLKELTHIIKKHLVR
jgi:hypothetical protein